MDILVKSQDPVEIEYLKDSPNGLYKKGDKATRHRIVAEKMVASGKAKLTKAGKDKE